MKAKEKPLLTKKQKKNRYEWAKSKLSWTVDDWAKIISNDESKFDVCVGDFRKRVIRSKDEAFHADCIKRTVKFPKGVMIWGCMSAKGLGNFEFIDGIVNAEKYQKILTNSLLPSINKLHAEENFIFQQDGALVIQPSQHKNGSLRRGSQFCHGLRVAQTLTLLKHSGIR
jgi:hypothetical protein